MPVLLAVYFKVNSIPVSPMRKGLLSLLAGGADGSPQYMGVTSRAREHKDASGSGAVLLQGKQQSGIWKQINSCQKNNEDICGNSVVVSLDLTFSFQLCISKFYEKKNTSTKNGEVKKYNWPYYNQGISCLFPVTSKQCIILFIKA